MHKQSINWQSFYQYVVMLVKMSQRSSVAFSEDSDIFVCKTLCNFSAKEDEDLSFEEGEALTITKMRDDGWWEAKNSSGLTGLVPSNFLKIPDHLKYAKRSVADEDKKKERAFREEDAKDMPSEVNFSLGFRESKLLKLLLKDPNLRMGSYMVPKLDPLGLCYDDIHYDSHTSSLKPNTTFIEKFIGLVAVRQVPQPPTGFVTKSCHVRMCLYDGNKILSNIHTVKAKPDENSSKMWTFKSKKSSKISCLEDGEIFIRSDISYPTLGILFDLCVSFEKFGDEHEMSCGWSLLRLLNDSGAPVKSKTKILKVQQTEMFASHLSHVSSPGKTSVLQKLRDQQKMPRIVVSICSPDRSSLQQMGFLPSTLIGPVSCIPVISLYRRVMCDDLFSRSTFESTNFIESSLLANVHQIFNEFDITNYLRNSWSEEMKNFKSSSIRGEKSKKQVFRNFFISTILPVITSNTLSSYHAGHWSNEKTREQEINKIITTKKNCPNDILTLSSDIEFLPLSLSTLCTRITQ